LPPPHSPTRDELDSTPEAAYDHLRSELDYEILEMRRVLRVGGHAVWRSAAKRPWYRQRFELAGFKGERLEIFVSTVQSLTTVEPIDIRENNQAIDRVNMYASCEWLCRASIKMQLTPVWRAEKTSSTIQF
jgi:betaine lipid synthase